MGKKAGHKGTKSLAMLVGAHRPPEKIKLIRSYWMGKEAELELALDG
jgi:hypothetical protein